MTGLRNAPLAFWRRVAAGLVRLSPAADAMAWNMRASGYDWPAVTVAVRRQHIRDRNARNQAKWIAKRDREAYRKEREPKWQA